MGRSPPQPVCVLAPRRLLSSGTPFAGQARIGSCNALSQIRAELYLALAEQAADRHADPAMVACKPMRWSWELTDEQRGGLPSRQFVRYGLMRLQHGNNLTGFTYGGMPRGLASVEEILARFPELTPSA